MLPTISIVAVGAFAFALFFYIQDTAHDSIRQSLFEQQRQRQIDTARTLAQHIGSDLNLLMSKLELVASHEYLQAGDLSSEKTRGIVREQLARAGEITVVDRFFVINADDVATISVVAAGSRVGDSMVTQLQEQQPLAPPVFEGADFSHRESVRQTRETLRPVFSDGYIGVDGTLKISLTHPIISRETGEYVGLAGLSIPAPEFFARYGNIYDIQSQYLAALDSKGVHLAHGKQDLVGKDFFGEYTQSFTLGNEDLNRAVRTVLSGYPAHAAYTIEQGERLTTGHPVFMQQQPQLVQQQARPAYAVFIVSPAVTIYSQVDGILGGQKTTLLLERTGLVAALGAFIVFVLWLNLNLNREVKKRTRELEESNARLAAANEQLKVHDVMQKDFISIAAHELRTPIQPILGMSEILAEELGDRRDDIKVIARNARRLQQLSEDILDVAKIESSALGLNKEWFELGDAILTVIDDYRRQVPGGSPDLVFEPALPPGEAGKGLQVKADRARVMQVLSNLVGNAIRFTAKGTITVRLEKSDRSAMVTVADSGTGISPEILPRLFTKFATERGTGLGLYISKSIVEAHGGRIWAKNNEDGKGAQFTFTLPLHAPEQQ